jgi:CspA family cold shock protein
MASPTHVGANGRCWLVLGWQRPPFNIKQEALVVITGTVKFWREGWGFIGQSSGPDVFVHRSALPASRTDLVTGEVVAFDVGSNEKGLFALNVKAVSGAEAEMEKAWLSKHHVRMGDV